MPESVKEGMRATLLRNVLQDAIDAVVEGTYDKCEGSHMSWTPMILDAQGREEMTQILERALLEAIAVQEGAKERLVSNGARGTSYTVSILGYPSIGGEKKVGPPTGAKELATSTVPLSPKAEKVSKKAKATGKNRTANAATKAKRDRRKDKDK